MEGARADGGGGYTEIYISSLCIVEANVSRFKHGVCQKKAKTSEAAALMAGLTAEWEQQEGWEKIRRRSGGFRYICAYIWIYTYTRMTEGNFTFYAACLFLKDIFLSLGHILRWTSVHKSYRDVQPFFFSLTKKEAQTVLTSLSPLQISWRNILNRRWCTGLNKYINTISSLWHETPIW